MKKKMFSLKMVEGSSLDDHIDEFNKFCDDLDTIDEGLSDGSLIDQLFTKIIWAFCGCFLYRRQTLSLEKVKLAFRTKKLKDKQESYKNSMKD